MSRGDGLLDDPADNKRARMLLTDGDGNASVDFTVGSRTGEGSHSVRVTTPGSLTFTEFCATGLADVPANIAAAGMAPVRGLAGGESNDPMAVISRAPPPPPIPRMSSSGAPDRSGPSSIRISALENLPFGFENPNP